jgi:hypothetical protein
MYSVHPSQALNRAFAAKCFQGAVPETADFLFVGLDANYSPTVEQNTIFPDLLAYLDDGPRFWRVHGVHHPFLLPEYRGDGRKYHSRFARIGFTAADAARVSFVELIHVPTYGRSALVADDLDANHLRRIRCAIEQGSARHIFVADGVGKLMRASKLFPWMPATPMDNGGPLRVWHKIGDKTVFWHYHLSVYGKFEKKLTDQLSAIRGLITAHAK